MRFAYAIEMTAMVNAVIVARMMARCACCPSALYASSGPYADDDRPSAPRPTQARKATSEVWWKISGSVTLRALPITIRRSLRNPVVCSAYGPDQAYRTLGPHMHLAIILTAMTAVTILIISTAYANMIEFFPGGGGGYLVATKLLGNRIGVV